MQNAWYENFSFILPQKCMVRAKLFKNALYFLPKFLPYMHSKCILAKYAKSHSVQKPWFMVWVEYRAWGELDQDKQLYQKLQKVKIEEKRVEQRMLCFYGRFYILWPVLKAVLFLDFRIKKISNFSS